MTLYTFVIYQVLLDPYWPFLVHLWSPWCFISHIFLNIWYYLISVEHPWYHLISPLMVLYLVSFRIIWYHAGFQWLHNLAHKAFHTHLWMQMETPWAQYFNINSFKPHTSVLSLPSTYVALSGFLWRIKVLYLMDAHICPWTPDGCLIETS